MTVVSKHTRRTRDGRIIIDKHVRRVKLRKPPKSGVVTGYHPIYRTVDDDGNTLTYVVKRKNYDLEYNTLKKAKVMAAKMEGFEHND